MLRHGSTRRDCRTTDVHYMVFSLLETSTSASKVKSSASSTSVRNADGGILHSYFLSRSSIRGTEMIAGLHCEASVPATWSLPG